MVDMAHGLSLFGIGMVGYTGTQVLEYLFGAWLR